MFFYNKIKENYLRIYFESQLDHPINFIKIEIDNRF